MRVFITSDLHMEFHADQGRSFMASLPLDDVDVLVVAGDLTNANGLPGALKLLCDSVPHVLYVNGNHDFYGSTPRKVEAIMRKLDAQLSNLHWLDESVAVIEGQRFVGTTLWFEDNPAAFRFRTGMNDFRMIGGFVPWVFEKCRRAVRFLSKTIEPMDIVVTHHLPSPACVHPDFRGSTLNPFFVCDIEPLVRRCGAAYWIHGHTHSSVDLTMGDPQKGETRVIANPFGYARMQENPEFKNLVIEV